MASVVVNSLSLGEILTYIYFCEEFISRRNHDLAWVFVENLFRGEVMWHGFREEFIPQRHSDVASTLMEGVFVETC